MSASVVVGSMGGFFRGARSVFSGSLAVLRDGQLRGIAFTPILLTGGLYLAGVLALLFFGPGLLAQVWARPESGWLVPLWYVVLIVAIAGVLVAAGLLFVTIAEAVGGPFYDRLAMRILGRYSIETREPGLIVGIVPDLLRSILFLVPTVICAALALIPPIALVFGGLGMLISSLGLASAAINPALAVTGHGVGARLGFVFRHFFTMLGLGAVVMLSLAVPFLALLTLPGSIVGASELYAKVRSQSA